MKAKTLSEWAQYLRARGWPKEIEPLFASAERVIAYCEVEGCTAISANFCHWCHKAICMVHSHPAISDTGHDVFVCPGCYFGEVDER